MEQSTGLKIKIMRITKGYKQAEFAEKIGISRYYLSALERDKANNPSKEIMKNIAEELGYTVGELFFNELKEV